jgi:hypothetical protein
MPSLPFKEEFTLERGNLTSGKIVYSANGSVELFVQPTDTEYQITDNAFAKSVRAWALRGTDIKHDDKVTQVSTGKVFKVGPVNDYPFGGIPHYEIVLEELLSESE